MLPAIPHLQGDGQNNGDSNSLENGDQRQLKMTHNVVRLPQEKGQTQTRPHQAKQSHKTQASPRGLQQWGPTMLQEQDAD